jgi:hypothetical protein
MFARTPLNRQTTAWGTAAVVQIERLDDGVLLELPDVKGLPLRVSDPRAQKPLPVKDMFIHQVRGVTRSRFEV